MAVGVLIVVFRRPFSDAARRQRELRGRYVGPNTQSPLVMGIGGLVFVATGIWIVLGTAAGLLHPH